VNGERGDAASMEAFLQERMVRHDIGLPPLRLKIRREELPQYRRLRWVIFDCELLDGMDASAGALFRKLVAQAKGHGCQILWVHMKPVLATALEYRGIIASHKDVFGLLDQAVQYIETHIIEYRRDKLDLWMQVHPGLAARHDQTAIASCFDPFMNIFETDAERRGCPWKYCKKMKIERFRTVLWEPGLEVDGDRACLFLVHSGSVGMYEELPIADSDGMQSRRTHKQGSDDGEYSPYAQQENLLPSAVYGHGWFLNREFLLQAPTRMHAIAIQDGEVLYWTRDLWEQMQRERPLMAAAIVKAAMRQLARDTDEVQRTAVAAMAAIGQGVQHAVMRASPEIASEESGFISRFASKMIHRPSKRIREPGEQEDGFDRQVSSASAFSVSGPRVETPMGRSRTSHQEKMMRLRSAGVHLPQELRIPLQRLATARALEHLDFWSAPCLGDAIAPYPRMPDEVLEDVVSAFDTYCHETVDGPRLSANDISKALMFAGIFGTELNDKKAAEVGPITESDFMAVAHEALLSPLTESQARRVKQIFEEHDNDKTGTLYRWQLPSVFRDAFGMAHHFEEIDSAAREVDHVSYHGKKEGQVNVEGFLWIVGRLVRKHEQDFLLLQSLRELTGMGTSTEEAKLTLEMLKMAKVKKPSGEDVTDEDWEEMLWAINFTEDKGGAVATHETEVCFNAVMAAVIAQEQQRWQLPTFQHEKLRARQLGLPDLAPVQAADASAETMRNLVVDQRNFSASKYQRRKECEEARTASIWRSETTTHSTISEISEADRKAQVEEQFQVDTGGRKRRVSTDSAGILSAGSDMGLRPKLCLMFEEPDSSLSAQLCSLVLAVLICTSILMIVLESLLKKGREDDLISNPWWWIELVFTILFTVEFCVRLSVCDALETQTIGEFFMTPSNISDLLSLLPVYLEAIFGVNVRVLHLFRVMRLINLSRAARVRRLANQFSSVGPVSTILVVIWAIYLKESGGDKAGGC
jgi:Ca2+-binding EF-hand superfamily protein/CRP-like cAMP-binding protein